MNAIAEKWVTDVVTEVVSGIMSEQRTRLRSEGKTSGERMRIPLARIHELVKSRIDGFVGVVDDFETEEEAEADAELQVSGPPTVEELRAKWVPEFFFGWGWNVILDDETVEFDLDLPAPRNAHAR